MLITIQNWGSAFICEIEFNGITKGSYAKHWGIALLKCYCKIEYVRIKRWLK